MKAFFRKSRLVLLAAAAVLLVLFALNAGSLLVEDDPKKSDVIVVLAGETDSRPAHALELLDAGYARRVVIDVPAGARIYQWTEVQLAEKYAQQLPQAAAVSVCPCQGLSTRDESHDVEKCLAEQPGANVLLVTSDSHTRRALSIFRHELRGRSFSVAAAHNPTHFGTRWWTHREWAKTCLDEWMKLVWWNVVERWR